MKNKTHIILAVIAAAVLVVGALFVMGKSRAPSTLETPLQVDILPGEALITNLAPQEVSAQEIAALVYMREEEKLARDVYTTLGASTGLRIFSNIARSEQTHMAAVGTLLTRYNITDPVKDDSVGVFTATVFSDLYKQLVAQGSVSSIEALRAGAFIEDLDIADLQERIAQTDNDDIRLVYENLMRGSRNHLRSFVSQLDSRGATYTPAYISAEEFRAIVDSPRETGGGSNR